MANNLQDKYIANPLNIKRNDGNLPTAKSSSKNVFILLIAFSVLGLTFNKVWAFAISYLHSPVLTGVIFVIVYGFIIFKVFSVSVMEEKKQVKAYKDLLENKTSDVSVIWEIQDVKDTETLGEQFAYIDYIDGTRTVILKCVQGSVLNRPPNAINYHIEAVTAAMEYVDSLGYTWHPHVVPESESSEKALNYYYDKMRNYDDEDFIDIFTEILDTIYLVETTQSNILTIYFEIVCFGKHKHTMFKNLTSLPAMMIDNTTFKEVSFIREVHEVDQFIANSCKVSMFDREELKMNKYKGMFNLGETATLAAYDSEGNLVKQFNKDLDSARKVRKKSQDIARPKMEVRIKDTKASEETIRKIHEVGVTLEGSNEEIKIDELSDTKHKKFIELLYSKDKVKLG